MNDFTGSAASQADFIWKNAEDLWGDFKGFVAQLKRRVSYPYPRRTYAIATVSGVPSWVNRLSKAART